MRRLVPLLLLALCTTPCLASGDREVPADASSLSALANKASMAPLKEQCYLYAQLVHEMTELAGRQMTAGEDASATLRSLHEYSEKIHLGLAQDTKKLKNAQILMENSTFRLKEILHSSSIDDRPALENALNHLDKVQAELMMQVFRH